MLTWQCLSFSELTTHQLYELLKLRVDIFVVEQTCPYPELDGKDLLDGVFHLIGYDNDEIIASARLLPKEISYPSISIGRVVTKAEKRGSGLGHRLVEEALRQCQIKWPNEAIEIGAQEHLSEFYRRYGFEKTSDMYLEDGIPHIDMKRSPIPS